VLDEEAAQLGVVDDPAGVGELLPCVAPVGGPVLADWPSRAKLVGTWPR
jgi:hypothetical protein